MLGLDVLLVEGILHTRCNYFFKFENLLGDKVR